MDSLEQEALSYKIDEVNYYIAQYIFEIKAKNSIEYNTVIDLTKGYFLRSAIYLQIGNPDITKASYRNTSFYYDGFKEDNEIDCSMTPAEILEGFETE